jgi:hypothetical protein
MKWQSTFVVFSSESLSKQHQRTSSEKLKLRDSKKYLVNTLQKQQGEIEKRKDTNEM